jgi:hypothetical protein
MAQALLQIQCQFRDNAPSFPQKNRHKSITIHLPAQPKTQGVDVEFPGIRSVWVQLVLCIFAIIGRGVLAVIAVTSSAPAIGYEKGKSSLWPVKMTSKRQKENSGEGPCVLL